MNRYAAPGTCDRDHHRNHFEPSVLAALRLLDRVEDGQDIDSADVQLALEVTGDAQCAMAEMREFRVIARYEIGNTP